MIMLSRVSAPCEILLNFLLREDSEIIRKVMLTQLSFIIINFELNKKSKEIKIYSESHMLDLCTTNIQQIDQNFLWRDFLSKFFSNKISILLQEFSLFFLLFSHFAFTEICKQLKLQRESSRIKLNNFGFKF